VILEYWPVLRGVPSKDFEAKFFAKAPGCFDVLDRQAHRKFAKPYDLLL
jgi:hypothetical protein